MLTNPVPKSTHRILEIATHGIGWRVSFVWAYLALALLGLVLAYAQTDLPAARGFIARWNADGVSLVVVTVLLTLIHWLASWMIRVERTRPAAEH